MAVLLGMMIWYGVGITWWLLILPAFLLFALLTALANFWFEAAHRASMSAKVVIPIRHPDQVTASLSARDGPRVAL